MEWWSKKKECFEIIQSYRENEEQSACENRSILLRLRIQTGEVKMERLGKGLHE